MIHKMGLQEEYYNLVSEEKKTVEVRLNDDKRKQIKTGDIIFFLKEPNREEKIETIVTDLKYFSSFDELLKEIPIEKMAFNKEKTTYLNDLTKFYPLEKQKEYGVVAIEVKKVIKNEKSCGIAA